MSESITSLPQNTEFARILRRNNKEIRQERADSIALEAWMNFKHTIDKLEMDLQRMKMSMQNLTDLSPDHAMSLMPAKDFEAVKFVDGQINLAINIRNTEIKLEAARGRFKQLFGGGE